jgi:hypothetical protein
MIEEHLLVLPHTNPLLLVCCTSPSDTEGGAQQQRFWMVCGGTKVVVCRAQTCAAPSGAATDQSNDSQLLHLFLCQLHIQGV